MAMRIRTVKPEFWRNEDLARLPEFTRLLALALLNYADDEGYFAANPALIRGELFPFVEGSVSIQVGLTELSNVDYLKFYNGKNGRIYGRVVTFTIHQKVSNPSKSKIAPLIDFTEPSVSLQGSLPLGTGNREQGKGTGSVEGGARDSIRRDLDRLPESLDTPVFRDAWGKWLVHCGERYNGGRAMSLATSDAHLKICLKLGPERAAAAIANSISKQLREPAEPFQHHGGKPATTTERHAKGFE